MSSNLKQVLARLAAVEAGSHLSNDGVARLLTLLRKFLEEADLKPNYRTLNLYCNWSLHTSLDRGGVQEILDEVSSAFQDPNAHPNDRVCEILSLAQLRAELRAILTEAGTSSRLLDTREGWKALVSVMAPLLLENSLVRTRKPSVDVYAESLRLEIVDLASLHPEYVAKAQLKPGAIFWKVRVMPKDVLVCGPFGITEQPEDFPEPRRAGS